VTAPSWSLLFHSCLVEQLEKLRAASDKAFSADSASASENANVKLYAALSKLIFETVPDDPARDEYRQGNTMGPEFRHWRRAKIGRRFRLFFRYDSQTKVIVYAWVNDEKTLRAAGSKNDPYAVFQKMLGCGNPPDDWNALLRESSKQKIPLLAKRR